MKKYGKLLALMLAFVMAASMFTACGEEQAQQQGQQQQGQQQQGQQQQGQQQQGQQQGQQQQEEPENDPTEDIKTVAEAYMDAIRSSDYEEAMKYVDEDSDLYENLEKVGDGLDDAFTEYGKAEAKKRSLDESYAEKIGKLYESFVKAASKKQEMEIDEVKVSDDKKTAEVKCSGKDLPDDFISESISEQKLKELAIEMYGEEGPPAEMMEEAIYSVYETMFELAERNLELEEVEKTVEVELIDGEWKITNIED